jgi:branched-chain amino acid transport system substrate-binding protein
MRRPLRIGALTVLVLIAAACGQKSDISDNQAAPSSDQVNSEETQPAPEATPAPEAAPAPDASAASPSATPAPTPAKAGTKASGSASGQRTASGSASGGSSGGGQSSAASPAPKPGTKPGTPAPGQAPAGPVDRTGVTDTVIKVGVHAPVTGAAPFPQNSFDKGKDVYWKWLAKQGGVYGRSAQIVFRDDQFNPSRAVQVCREMVEQEKVFLLIGAAGSEQITACARYAASAGVPYLSGGVNEEGLTGLKTYFAVSQSYSQQNPLLVQLVKNQIKKQKLAIVLNNTPALNEAQKSITAAAQQAGLTIVRNSRIGKNASDSELVAEANQLRTAGAEVVYILTSPVNFIKLANAGQAQAYNPIYVGPGVTNGINIVAEAGCPAIGKAKFLSPFPQLDAIDQYDPDYKKAYREQQNSEGDDIGLAQWGLSKVIGQMMQAAGKDLSRQSFMAALESGKTFESKVYPVVSYGPSIRFGAKSSSLLEADCQARKYKTLKAFATGF